MVKKKVTLALFPLALCFSSAHVLAAATMADLEKRIAEQEKQIVRLNNTLKGTRAAVKEDRSRIQEMQERLKINGFLTAGVASNDGDPVEDGFNKIGDNYSTSAVNKLGVQMTFEVADNISATAQMVSKGNKDYQLEAEWAYITYEATNDLRFNFGRQRIPYYLLSEYLDVGYALPWVIPPIEMYNIPISAFDGVSAIYGFELAQMNFTWHTYGGASGGYSDQLEAEFEQNQSWGTNLTAEVGHWTFRLGFTSSHLDADPDQGGTGSQLIDALTTAEETLVPLMNASYAANVAGVNALAGLYGLNPYSPAVGADWLGKLENIQANYYSSGFMYDNGKLLVLGELSNLNVDDTFQPVGDGGYLTVGYRFGKFMPYVTYAKFQTDSKNDNQVRQMQEYVKTVGDDAYLIALAANYALTGNPLTANQFTSSSLYCTLNPSCTAAQVVGLSKRDQLLSAAEGYGETLYNTLEQLVQEQQSYTIGLVYDVTARVKAKAQVTHYEGFGSGDYQYLGSTASTTATTYSGFSSADIDGNGRFSGDPGAAGNHTAIYSFSIDAVF